jgi:hypothetical protein
MAMFPTYEEVQRVAYERWERRGYAHGNDAGDWLAAEQELRFTKNYRVIARYRLDGVAASVVGHAKRPICRFCERSPAQAAFTLPHAPLPRGLGNGSVLTSEECDECRQAFEENVETHLERFAEMYVRGAHPPVGNAARTAAFDPIAAYKGLVRFALAIMPETELHLFRDALEWVANTDHQLDINVIGDLECVMSVLPDDLPFSSAALACKLDEDAPFPHMLLFWGTKRAVFEIALPLCSRDEDLDGERLILPRVGGLPGMLGHSVENTLEVVLMGSSNARSQVVGISQ